MTLAIHLTSGQTAALPQAFVRLVQVKSGKELCRFTLSGAQLKQRGLIYAKIYRWTRAREGERQNVRGRGSLDQLSGVDV